MSEPGEPRGRDPSGTIGRNLEPFLLIELLHGPSYGYDLIRRLADYGFRRASNEPGVVYKVLRSLEESGAIKSTWSTAGSGPARRYYELTDDGQQLLRRRARHLNRYRQRVERFLQVYTELTSEDFQDDHGEDDLVTAARPARRARG